MQKQLSIRISSVTRQAGLALAALAALMNAQAVLAHPRDMTLSSLHLAEEGVRIETILPDAIIDALPSAQADGASADRAARVARGYRLESESGPCPVVGEPRAWRLNDIDARRYVVDYRCPASPPAHLTLHYTLATGVLADGREHENFLTARIAGHALDTVLTRRQNSTTIPVAHLLEQSGRALPPDFESTGIATPGTADFLWLGTEHILAGLDHVVFLVGLFLLTMGTRALLGVISAFTLGHSVTLGLSTLGLYSPVPWIAESVIALSIVYLGAENLYALSRRTPQDAGQRHSLTRHRWAVAGLFGLMHGFGFSYVLRDMGLPEDAMFSSLLGFNLGVEIGQLLVVAALVPVLAWMWKRFSVAAVSVPCSLALLAIGSWWLAERTLLG